jgi:hypothetical protein
MSFSAVNLNEVITQVIIDEILNEIVPTIATYNSVITPQSGGPASNPPNHLCVVNLSKAFNSEIVSCIFQSWQFVLGGATPANDVEIFLTDASLPLAFRPTQDQLCSCVLFDIGTGINSSISIKILTTGIISFQVIGDKAKPNATLTPCGMLNNATFTYLST